MDILTTLSSRPLDLDSSVPLYQQLKARMLEVIATRALGEGTPLPTEEQIASALGLSRGTVRRCFQDLVDEGRVVRRRGQGTFVTYRRAGHDITTAFNFTAEMSALGMRASSKVLSLRRRAAKGGIARRLAIPDDAEVWEIRRLRLADDKPMQVVTAYVPCTECPELTRESLESSLYALIAEASGRMPAKAEELYEAVNLDKSEARALEVPDGTAALRIIRTTYDSAGLPFEASVIVLRADRNRFMLTLDANGTSFAKVTS